MNREDAQKLVKDLIVAVTVWQKSHMTEVTPMFLAEDALIIIQIHSVAFLGEPAFQALRLNGYLGPHSACFLFEEVHPDARDRIKIGQHFHVRHGHFTEAGQKTRFERVEFP